MHMQNQLGPFYLAAYAGGSSIIRRFDSPKVSRFLRATAATAVARLSHRNSVRPSVRPFVRHTGDSVKNDAN